MYNDPIAIERFGEIVAEQHYQTIVETGTHEGNGTMFLSQYAPTHSIEIKPENWHGSQENVFKHGFITITTNPVRVSYRKCHSTGCQDISLHLGDSEQVLPWLIPTLASPVLFYLDAHWGARLPLLGELKAIAESGVQNCSVIVHDCLVPGMKEAGYDEYDGVPISYEFMREGLTRINPNFKISYNRAVSGDCRGILYALP